MTPKTYLHRPLARTSVGTLVFKTPRLTERFGSHMWATCILKMPQWYSSEFSQAVFQHIVSDKTFFIPHKLIQNVCRFEDWNEIITIQIQIK